MSDLPIIIAGGGIGGLAAACGLARKGHRSIVVEQAPALGEIGAGIQIGPNAFHCFDYLGVGDEAREKAVYIDKRELKCACVGGDSNVPLGFVSLTENLMMISMAVWMIFKPMGIGH